MKRFVAAILACASPAHAETLLGFRVGGASLPLPDDSATMIQISLGIEHAAFGRTRVLAEYEWAWIHAGYDHDNATMATPPGMGHRANLGLRRALASFTIDNFQLYADGELGGGLGIYDAPAQPVVVPHGFVGLRVGFTFGADDSRGARLFETEALVRAFVVEHGVGVGGGVGFYWGD